MNLSAQGIRVLAISNDTVEKAALHATRDSLDLTLLADPDLDVIRQFGLEHEGSLEFGISGTVAGIPMAVPTGFKSMAIPTTLLVDEEGTVRWIDQADDYRLRGDEARIRDALTTLPSS